MMIGFFAKLLLTRNPALTMVHARRLATAGLVAAGILVAAIGIPLWLHFHDAAVEKRVNLERDNSDLRANADANEAAGISKAERDAREAAEQEELEDEVDEAEADGRSAADDVWSGGLFDEPQR